MIKEIIRDLAFDRITVSQALTRAKLIAHQIKNETFKAWLNKELSGYENDDTILPDYRKVWAEIHLTAELPYGQTHTFPVVFPDNRKDLDDLWNYHRVISPISIIELDIEHLSEGNGTIYLPGGAVQKIGELYKVKVQSLGGVIRNGKRTIGKAQLANIVELTKQKLIDTLQDLEEQFPELDNKYIMNEENNTKAQNIITNNIYGNNNPLNVAAGESIKQGDIDFTINEAQYDKLRELGVQEVEVEELKSLDNELPKGNPERKGKIMGWLGKVTASLTARGIYDAIPELVENVGDLI